MCADRSNRITPMPISGFPEWSPAERMVEQRMLDQIRAAFERSRLLANRDACLWSATQC